MSTAPTGHGDGLSDVEPERLRTAVTPDRQSGWTNRGETVGARIQLTLALACALLMLSGGPAAAAPAEVLGTAGSDLLRGTARADGMDGRGGDDELRGLGGADRLRGSRGRDTLLGGHGRDFLDGGSGPDRLRAGRDSDRLLGRGGADQLWGQGGNDAMAGGAGSDVVRPGSGGDEVHLGTGRDRATLSVDGAADRVDCGGGLDRVTLRGGVDPLDTLVGCEQVVGGDVTGPPPPAPGGFLTLHFGRTQWEQRDATCTEALPDSVSLLEVADELKGRGLKGVGNVVVDRTSESAIRSCENRFAYPTWDDLALLRDSYGWSFVSAGATYANMTKLTPEQQWQESCGSLEAFIAHGHLRANGLFAYPNNKLTPEIQNDVVSTCFGYGRRYGPGDNARAEMPESHLQSTVSVNGGACNDLSQLCSDPATHGGRRYALPSQVATRMNPEADHWSAVQFYRFVKGTRDDAADPSFAWDCTSEDPGLHWTSKAEIYCWEDFKLALDKISPNVVVTDPLDVAQAWGRLP
jgi:hypothetical protein